MANRLLLLEDERNLGATLRERLEQEGFEVDWATSLAQARTTFANPQLSVALLDVGLPDGSGFDLAQELRSSRPEVAIVFLTALGAPEDRVRGLELGAEDYVTKPFHWKELLLRVRNAHRRAQQLVTGAHDAPASGISLGRARVHFERFEAIVDGKVHPLTHKECALLRTLVDAQGRVVSRDEILDRVWSQDEFPSPRTVDNFILKLRKLIEATPRRSELGSRSLTEEPTLIRSVRGIGYQLILPEAPEMTPPSSTPSHRFKRALERKNEGHRPPIWLMRQAGRYHSHYQALRAKHSFMELCKDPEIACEVTLGPMRDFGFDAAILFSDLLFPLEVMGMGLRYEPGPKLDWHLRSRADLSRLGGGEALANGLQFQAEAVRRIRHALPADKGLLGFVGGPLTLFAYAVEGGHQSAQHAGFASAHAGLTDGRWEGFCDRLLDLLAENMALQARAGTDTVAVLDTAAGEWSLADFREHALPVLRELLARFHARAPGHPVVYYSKGTTPEHFRALESLPIAGLGVDWTQDLPELLREFSPRFAIQGAFDPSLMLGTPEAVERALRAYFEPIAQLPAEARRGWICGLGHGVLQNTPESSVRTFVRVAHEVFGEEA